MIPAWGLAVTQLSGGEKNYVVYSVFCKFITIIIRIVSSSSISSISISFVGLLNCLYLNLQVLPFAHFSSPSR